MTRYFMKTKTLVSSVALAALATACGGLDVTNTTNPDAKTVVSNGDDVRAIITNQFQNWFTTTQDTYPNNALAAMSDDMTSSFGNFGMRFNSNEPRIAYGNLIGGSDEPVSKNPWNNNYSAIGGVNAGLRAMNEGIKITAASGDSSCVRGLGYFIAGASFGNLALQFDRAFVPDETYVPNLSPKPELEPYTSVSAKAVALLDRAIALPSCKLTKTEASKDMTNTYLKKLENTMAARILAYTPRTKAENDAVNWTKVLGYANAGISTGTGAGDFSVTGDGGTLWYDLFKAYSERGTWMRVDNRVINMMDPTNTYPTRATSTTTLPKCTQCPDLRISGTTPDFVYKTTVPFNSARGVYHFSNYAHERYFYHTYDAGNPLTGEAPMILAAENDLLIAEALVRTNGDRQRAADLINKTRVGRGGLAALSATSGDAALLAGIFYERHVELLGTGGGLSFYDRRRQDELQPGTPLHLPIPASELQTLGMPIYTFGGAAPNPVFPVK